MTDEEYVFRETERERKRNGRGSFNKVRQGGKHVRMPSDNMSKKERNAMNGEVKSWDFSKPLQWKQFQKMPRDLRQQYLDGLGRKYPGLSNAIIAESFGVGVNVFNPYLSRYALKIDHSVTMSRREFYATEGGKRWKEWIGGEAPVEAAPAEEAKIEPTSTLVNNEVLAAEKTADINNIAVLLNMLAGSGAELTIKFKL